MVCIVYFTAADEEEGLKIGGNLVEEKLAVCINVFPVKSVYWWKGNVKKSDEVGVFVKTKEELFEKIVKRIRELHSYELPSIEKIDVKSYGEIEKWVDESTK